MAQDPVFLCPKGHSSSDRDYCGECGAKIEGNSVDASSDLPGLRAADSAVCPDCGIACDRAGATYCEVCGYNFKTGSRGEIPVSTAPEPKDEPLPEAQPTDQGVVASSRTAWSAVVGSGETLVSAVTEMPLSRTTHLIGRRDEELGILPEIAVSDDAGVSRRHAVLYLDPTCGLSVRDLGATNGTRLNGRELEPMVRYSLHDGDEITLGKQTRIRIKAN